MSEECFEFNDGKSSKFWNIGLNGTSFTVRFGKTGTNGQTQTKVFASEDEASEACEKLIREKIQKGYVPAAESNRTLRTDNVVALNFAKRSDGSRENAASAPTTQTSGSSTTVLVDKLVGETAPAFAPKKREATNHLHPEDYVWCTWLPRVVNLRRPKPLAFDRTTTLKTFSALSADGYKWLGALRKRLPNPLNLSREEAEFWWRAVENFSQMPGATVYERRESNLACQQTKEKIFQYLQTVRLTGAVTTADMDKMFNFSGYQYTSEPLLDHLSYLLCALCPPSDLILYASGQPQEVAFCIMYWFRELVLPYLSDKELDLIQDVVRPHLRPEHWSAPTRKSNIKTLYLIASFLRMSTEISELVRTWSSLQSQCAFPEALLLCLPCGEELIIEAKRLQLDLSRVFRLGSKTKIPLDELFLRAWLAATGTAHLDPLIDAIYKAYSKEDAERRFKILALLETPGMVHSMIALLDSSASHLARTWLETHAEWSVPELLIMCAQKSKKAEVARDILQTVRNFVSAHDIGEEAAAKLQQMFHSADDALPIIDAESMPEWLATAIAQERPSKVSLPDWISPSAVPPVIVDKRKLAPAQMEQVLGALKRSTLENVSPLVTAVKANIDARYADRTVWWLFEKWLKAGAPPKEKWAMLTTGLLGSDETALKLTPLIRQWPGESQHARAVTGLDCLRKIGTDTALMQISSIAQKVQFKGIKQKALESMEEIAKERGLSREQLEDRIIPDCGLDKNGRRIFDFGGRTFSFTIAGDLKPMLKDTDGKIRTDLPKANSKDDPDMVQKASLDWKLLKQQVKDISKVQAHRLEQAMVTGRRWQKQDFDSLLVKHPLMIHLVRLLIWGAFDIEGKLIQSFRVTEDHTFADHNDKLLSLNEDAEIGVVHPLNLPAEERSQWGEMLSDYDIIAPFPQLGRPIYKLDSQELKEMEITRFANKTVPAVSIVNTLEKQGWQRGPVEDGGCFSEHTKYFPGADITATAEYDYIAVGMILDSNPQEIKRCYFERGKPDHYRSKSGVVPLEFVDSIVLSEVLADLTLLTGKAIEA